MMWLLFAMRSCLTRNQGMFVAETMEGTDHVILPHSGLNHRHRGGHGPGLAAVTLPEKDSTPSPQSR